VQRARDYITLGVTDLPTYRSIGAVDSLAAVAAFVSYFYGWSSEVCGLCSVMVARHNTELVVYRLVVGVVGLHPPNGIVV